MMRVFRELIDAILNRKKVQSIPVITYRTHAQIIASGQGAYIRRRHLKITTKSEE